MDLIRLSKVYDDEVADYSYRNKDFLTLENFISEFSYSNHGEISIHDDLNSDSELVVSINVNKEIEIINENYYNYYKDLIVDRSIASGGWGLMNVTIFSFILIE